MNSHTKAKFSMIFSTIVFGTLSIFVRNIPLSSGELALYRAVLAAFLVSLYLIVKKNPIPFREIKKELPFLILSGGAMGCSWILLFQSYRYTSVSLATLSYYFTPVIVIVACPLLFHERMTKKQIFCFLMSTLGLVLLVGVSGVGQPGADIIGIALALIGAVFYASVILLNKFIQNTSGLHRTLMQFLSAIVILTPYVAFTSGFHLGELNSFGLVTLLIVGLFHTGFVYCLYFSALKVLPGQEASILSYIDPTVAVFVSFFVFHEAMTPLQMIGGLLVLGFSLYNEIGNDAGSDETASER